MKRPFTIWLVVLLTPACLALSMGLGPARLGLPDWHSEHAIFVLRLTRVLAGFVIGAGLSCSGVVLQALLRNPLAEPYVLGVSSGAGLGAAAAILTGATALGVLAVPLAAFVFGLATLAVVYALGSRGGSPSIYSLILSGVIVSAVCSSLLMFLVSLAPVEGMHSVMWWMLGNLEVPSYALFIAGAALCAGGCAAIWLLAPELNALTLGQQIAHTVGVRTRLATALALVCATLVTAAAVGLAGLIGFVGLIVPHAMRGLVGADHRRLVPAAALGGGAFLALCDAVARTLLAPREIPVGVVTALLGGPFFLALLHRRRRGWIA